MNIASLLLLMAIGCGPKDSTQPAPKISMRCFDVPKPTVVNDLRVRTHTETSKDLFVDRVLRKVYLYDYEDDTLTLVDRGQWEKATGTITYWGTERKFNPRVYAGEIHGKLQLEVNDVVRRLPTGRTGYESERGVDKPLHGRVDAG